LSDFFIDYFYVKELAGTPISPVTVRDPPIVYVSFSEVYKRRSRDFSLP